VRVIHQPFVIQPAGPPTAYKTYAIHAPLATHWNTVTCADVDCPHYLTGWDSVIDERTDLGGRQAHYIRRESGRKFTEERQPDGLTRFRFEAGQRCFQQHKARNMRDERYVERDGDHRGNPTGRRYVHKRPGEWVESFQANQERVKAIQERG
jgi:hypothetical protein